MEPGGGRGRGAGRWIGGAAVVVVVLLAAGVGVFRMQVSRADADFHRAVAARRRALVLAPLTRVVVRGAPRDADAAPELAAASRALTLELGSDGVDVVEATGGISEEACRLHHDAIAVVAHASTARRLVAPATAASAGEVETAVTVLATCSRILAPPQCFDDAIAAMREGSDALAMGASWAALNAAEDALLACAGSAPPDVVAAAVADVRALAADLPLDTALDRDAVDECERRVEQFDRTPAMWDPRDQLARLRYARYEAAHCTPSAPSRDIFATMAGGPAYGDVVEETDSVLRRLEAAAQAAPR